MGNPTVFSDYKFTWENGRELAVVKNRSTNAEIASYEYNSSGMRISKTTSDGTAYYAYDENNNLIYEKHNNYSMVFHYDGNGVRTHFDYAGTSVNGTYYYRYNAQGDVIALLDSTGTIVAEYDYTAYGMPIRRTGMVSSSVGNRNPFRYRGYYYDTETELYYLQSRYYDAYLGRFVNTSGSVSDNNLFAYGQNDPVNILGSSAIFGAINKISGEIVGGVRLPSSDVGAAWEYEYTNSEEYNCYAYALGLTKGLNVGEKYGKLPYNIPNVYHVAEYVEKDLKKMNRSIRVLSNMNDKLYPNEVKIALRTGVATQENDKEYDYHFMVLTKSGQWAHKLGDNPSELLDYGCNPENTPWKIGFSTYYDSAIVYFAVDIR